MINISKENTTKYIILGLLTHEEMTGYSIKKRIEYSIKNFWDIGYGQIYPTLKKIESEGLISKSKEVSSNNNNKIIYKITDTGREELIKWLNSPIVSEYVKYELLLKLFFGNQTSLDKNMERIMDFHNKSEKQLNIMDRSSQSLLETINQSDDHFYYYLTVLFGKHIYQAYIDWAKEAEMLLKNKKIEKGEKPT